MTIIYEHNASPIIQSLVAFGAGAGAARRRKQQQEEAMRQQQLALALEGITKGAQDISGYYVDERRRKDDFEKAIEKMKKQAELDLSGRTELENLRHKNRMELVDQGAGIDKEARQEGQDFKIGLQQNAAEIQSERDQYIQGQYAQRAQDNAAAISARMPGLPQNVAAAMAARGGDPAVPEGITDSGAWDQYLQQSIEESKGAIYGTLDQSDLERYFTTRQDNERAQLLGGADHILRNPKGKLDPEHQLSGLRQIQSELEKMEPAGTRKKSPEPQVPFTLPDGSRATHNRNGEVEPWKPDVDKRKATTETAWKLFTAAEDTYERTVKTQRLLQGPDFDPKTVAPFDRTAAMQQAISDSLTMQQLLDAKPGSQPDGTDPNAPPTGVDPNALLGGADPSAGAVPPPGSVPREPPADPGQVIQVAQEAIAKSDVPAAEYIKSQPPEEVQILDESLAEKFNTTGSLTPDEWDLVRAIKRAKQK